MKLIILYIISVVTVIIHSSAFADERCVTGDYICKFASHTFRHTNYGSPSFGSPNEACAWYNREGEEFSYTNGRAAFRAEYGVGCEYDLIHHRWSDASSVFFAQGWLGSSPSCDGAEKGLGTQVFSFSKIQVIEGIPFKSFMCGHCPKNSKYVGNGICQSEQCAEGEIYNNTTGQCESPCPEGHTSNPLISKCTPPPEEKSCEATGAHPIGFSDGQKYRNEFVISVGSRSPITFKYRYSNHNNHEVTAHGVVSHKNIPHAITASMAPIPLATYTANYNEQGLLKNNTVLIDQYYGGITQYWRHNFDDVLQIRGANYTLHFANGESQEFAGIGQSASYPSQALLALENGDATFEGYKWVNYKTGQEKHFDNTGKLRTIKNSSQDMVTLTYTNNQLTQITNNFGDSLTLEYSSKATSSIYNAMSTSTQDYVTKVTTNKGQSVNLEWNQSFRGQTATFYLLTRITEPTTSTATTARDFAYSDSRWPASLTDIYTVSDISNNTQKLYAHFEYDDQGRAIYSGLAGGVEAVQVDYADELTSIVTNALGKKATYSFDFISGVKKLKKVVGEPTSSCLRSEVEYTYNPSGTLFEKTQNNRTTRYTQYDSKNRELERVEAFGTVDAKTIKTEWHPTLNLKTKVIEPKTTTVWEYFEDGKLNRTRIY